MDILISFITSVGVVESLKVLENVAVDVVNQSIVLSLKNIKTPNPSRPGDRLNNRDINSNSGKPPDSFGNGFREIIKVTEYRTTYWVVNWSPGVPYRVITQDWWANSVTGIKKEKRIYYSPSGTVNLVEEFEEIVYSVGAPPCNVYGASGNPWGGCSYTSEPEPSGDIYSSFYSADVSYSYYPL